MPQQSARISGGSIVVGRKMIFDGRKFGKTCYQFCDAAGAEAHGPTQQDLKAVASLGSRFENYNTFSVAQCRNGLRTTVSSEVLASVRGSFLYGRGCGAESRGIP